jgi:hypothetical protein
MRREDGTQQCGLLEQLGGWGQQSGGGVGGCCPTLLLPSALGRPDTSGQDRCRLGGRCRGRDGTSSLSRQARCKGQGVEGRHVSRCSEGRGDIIIHIRERGSQRRGQNACGGFWLCCVRRY